MTVLLSYWCWNSSRKFSECILTWKSLKFEYLCWMTDVWKRKRPTSGRCSPTSTTTTATDYWATSGSADTAYASSGAESVESTNWWSTAWQVWWILEGTPPVFSHATDPLEADDWLCAVEKQLNIAQCDDQQKVLYASGQLQGEAQDWWESFEYGHHANAPPVIW